MPDTAFHWSENISHLKHLTHIENGHRAVEIPIALFEPTVTLSFYKHYMVNPAISNFHLEGLGKTTPPVSYITGRNVIQI